MNSRSQRPENPVRGRPGTAGATGFTLAEILVALVITGVLAATVITLLVRQNEFYQTNDDMIFAEQTIRAATEFMASELRMASPEDLASATSSEVELAFDVRRAVVCESGSGTATLFVYHSVPNANLASTDRGTAVSGPHATSFDYDDDWAPTVDDSGENGTSGTPWDTCTSSGAPDGAPDDSYRLVDWAGSSLAEPDPGSIVRTFGVLSYRFDESSFGSGTALWRGDQELVGPFGDDARFEYVMDDGSVQSSASVGFGNLSSVRRVRIRATALGKESSRHDVTRDIAYDVALRN